MFVTGVAPGDIKVKQATIQPGYFSKKDLCVYSGACERTVSGWLKDPTHPLPHFRLGRKMIRIKRADFDAWIEKYRRDDKGKVDEIVDEVMKGLI